MWVCLEKITYAWVVVGIEDYIYARFGKGSRIHTQVSLGIGAYNFVQFSTWDVSIAGYFQGSLSHLRDGINILRNILISV